MTRPSTLERDLAMPAIVTLVTIFAAAVRLSMPLNASAPLNDGGLFYSMIEDIQANGFALPMVTSYNTADIPFTYPPLALYFTALISSSFHLSAFDLLRLLPPLLSALCIPAFYLLAREISDSKPRIALAVLVFAFLPRTFDWLIMGGGITRSAGLFFALLAMRQFYRVFKHRTSRPIPLAILFGASVIVTHPEAAVHAVIAALVFYVMEDRSPTGLARGAGIAAGAAVLSAPWWLTIILRHGLGGFTAPFAAAGQDSASLPIRLLSLFQFKFTDEPFVALLAVLGLLGAAILLMRREYLLPVWLTASHLLEPRGGSLYMMIPHALMAAAALELLVLPSLRGRPADPAATHWVKDLLEGRFVRWGLGYLCLYILISALMITFSLYQKFTLKPADLEAFRWVHGNTPASAQFVLLTGENVLRDATSEWFPALTGRGSQATIFGYEWVNDGKFIARRAAYNTLQACADQEPTCLDDWSRESGQSFDYIYIRKYVEDRPDLPALAVQLAYSVDYEQVYDSEGAVIFRRLPAGQ